MAVMLGLELQLAYEFANDHAVKINRGVNTDIHQRSQNLHHLYSSMGLNSGVFRFFRIIKITTAPQVRMSLHLLQSKREDKTYIKC